MFKKSPNILSYVDKLNNNAKRININGENINCREIRR